MPRLDLGAVRATLRQAMRRFDAWTLESLNSPAGGRRPRLYVRRPGTRNGGEVHLAAVSTPLSPFRGRRVAD
jgi:hypothetical protein